jgi:molybdopterin-guanine dinucleotide biosynthesis protein A
METVMSLDMNESTPPDLYGLILGGGQSSRMGQDKALIQYHGEPQGRYCQRVLSGFCAQVFLSCRVEQWDQPNFQAAFQELPVILDTQPDIGPMAGLLAAMESRPNTAWLVLACDMPGIDAACIALLVNHRNPSRFATAFYTTDATGKPRIEPLFTIYEPACFPYIKQQVQIGRTGLRPLLHTLHAQGHIHGLELTQFPPKLGNALRSLNTPEAARNWSLP